SACLINPMICSVVKRLFFISVLVIDGLYSFMWYGSVGAGQNRDSNPDQITAMYDDIDYFRARYTGHLSQDKIAGTMTFPEYVYACHYRGPYKPQKFDGDPEVKQVVSDFRDKWLVLSLHVQ
ncbi:hypothetical protein, partial [Luteibacter jiangsuensis]|uniref:hypothetical protein n=1 Tax=Luteibacter jiangsuensis TaxID=637577 RepID=UPI0019650B47